VLFLVLFGVAVLQTVLVQGQLRLDTVRADVATRQNEAQTLRNRVAELESPGHIIDTATGMGMTVAGDRTIVIPPASTEP
jgi:cell division protein FtsL